MRYAGANSILQFDQAVRSTSEGVSLQPLSLDNCLLSGLSGA